MRKALAILLIVALAVPLLAACGTVTQGTSQPQPTTEPPAVASPATGMPTAIIPTEGASVTDIAARVNGQEISLATFQKQFLQFMVALSDQGLDLTSEEGKAALAQVRVQVLNSLIELALIEQAAAQRNITVTDDELNARVEETITAGGGNDKFQAWLQESGITEAEFRDQLRSEMLTDAVIHDVTDSVPDTAEQVHARHILVGTEEKAQQVLARLQSGEDFAAVARDMSEDDVTRADGGDLGFFPQGMLSVPVEVEDAAFALQAGQISGVVRSPYGYHIIQVLERQTDRPLPTEVYQVMKQRAFDTWLQQQRASAQIEMMIPTE